MSPAAGPRPPLPRAGASGLGFLLVLLLPLVLVACDGASSPDDASRDAPLRPPAPEGQGTAAPAALGGGATAGADVPAFSGDAAFAHLRHQVELGPRAPGGPGHAAQLAWMRDFLEQRADTVIVQPFEHTSRDGRSIGMTNVFARFHPERRERLLVLAHWDSRPTADADPDPDARARPIPGANDGASGTAVLLELADVLSRHSPPIGVDLLFTDGEDFAPGEMYLGAQHFAANLPRGYSPLYGVLVDMVGDADPRFPVEENSWRYAPEVVSRVWGVAAELGHGARFPRQVGSSIQDDHIPLNRAGIPTVNIIDFEYGPGNRYWHTHADRLEHTSPVGLGVVGEVLTALIYRGG